MRSVLGAFSYDEVCTYFQSRPIRRNVVDSHAQVIANRNSLNERLNVVIGDSISVRVFLS